MSLSRTSIKVVHVVGGRRSLRFKYFAKYTMRKKVVVVNFVLFRFYKLMEVTAGDRRQNGNVLVEKMPIQMLV